MRRERSIFERGVHQPCIDNDHGKNGKVNTNRPILCFDLLLDPKIVLTIPIVPVNSTTSSIVGRSRQFEVA